MKSQVLAATQLARLREFLALDPNNSTLLAECADVAFQEDDLSVATTCLDKLASFGPLTPDLQNLKGLIALREARFRDAIEVFGPLVAEQSADPSLRFNLTWALTKLGDPEAASQHLTDDMVQSPQAAALRVRILHGLGEVEDAIEAGRGYAERFPDSTDLNAALATVALDAEDLELAAACARRAPEHHESLSTLGLLALNGGDRGQAMAYFDRALARFPFSGRALIGRGLGLMLNSDLAGAAKAMEQAANVFGSHVGTWVVLGWIQLMSGDPVRARATFEKALEVGEGFAESHGSLAVVEALEDRIPQAERLASQAEWLDRKSFSAAYARSLIAAHGGDAERAAQLQKLALNVPIEPGGPTLGQLMAGLLGLIASAYVASSGHGCLARPLDSRAAQARAGVTVSVSTWLRPSIRRLRVPAASTIPDRPGACRSPD